MLRHLIGVTVLLSAAIVIIRGTERPERGENGRAGKDWGGGPVYQALDTNRDGVISRSEIDNAMKSLLALDENRDGRLSPSELGQGSRPKGNIKTDGGRPGYRMPTQAFRTDVPPHDYDVIIGRPTNTEVTLSVLALKDLEIEIRHGVRREDLNRTIGLATLRAGAVRHVLLNNLSPATRHHFRLATREPGRGPFHPGPPMSFHTARPPGSTFVFTIQADSHLDFGTVPELYANTLRNAVGDGSDFHIALGDTFMVDKRTRYQDAAPQYLAQRYYFGLLAETTALFFVLGNHDGEFGYRPEMAEWSAAMRRRHLPNPLPNDFYTGNPEPFEDYYAWRWGDAHFICLDPFRYTTSRRGGQWTKTLGERQYRWLQHTLETSTAKYKFIFVHYLLGGLNNETRGAKNIAHLYEWGGRNTDGVDEWIRQRPGWETPIHDLCVKHGVDIVFHGHDHLYVKEELDGVIYQEVPQPGHQRFNNTKTAAEYGYDGVTFGSSGHLRVTVAPNGVTSEYVWSFLPGREPRGYQNGQVAHAYTIRPHP